MTARFEYVSLSVHDLDATVEFYAAVFGVNQVRSRLDLPEHKIRSAIVASTSGLAIEFFERADSRSLSVRDAIDAAATTGWVHLAIRVDDVGAAVEHALAAGATVVSAPAAARRPDTWFAYLQDPEGNLLELVTTNPTRQ